MGRYQSGLGCGAFGTEPAGNRYTRLRSKRRDAAHMMALGYAKQAERIETRHNRSEDGLPCLIREMQQPTPFGAPAFRQAQHLSEAPVLARDIVVMRGQKVSRLIARGLRIGEQDMRLVCDAAQEVEDRFAA